MSTTEMEVDRISNPKSSTREETNGKHSRRSESRTSERRDRDRDRERDRERDKDRDRDRRRPSDRDRERDRERDKDRDRYHDRERDRDREYRPKRGYSRERDYDRDRDYRRDRDRDRERDRERDRDDRREKRPREDPDEGGPDAKRRKEDPVENGSASGRKSEPRSEKKDHSRESERRRRNDDDPQNHRRREERPPRQPPPRRPSPSYAPPPDREQPEELDGDSEQRSVFISQLAARLTARDLGYFFEEKLGDNTVIDARIVTDRLSRRSKGIGYVELRSLDLVPKAIALTGNIVMGLPVKVQLTEAERNRVHVGDILNLPPGVTAPPGGPMQLYVGSLHFQLTESDIKQVFEPFGELEFVDLHRDPATGRSKGYCFIQYKKPEDAKMALEQMDGFELAGRTLRVNTVYEKGAGSGGGTGGRALGSQAESLDEGGGNLNAVSRQALMQKLARTEQPTLKLPEIKKPVITQTMQTRCLLLTNMFDPAEETEPDWEKTLADDVKVECETKYNGTVEHIQVDKESERGEIYLQFGLVETAGHALQGLNGRWFGGRQISATYISDAMMKAHM